MAKRTSLLQPWPPVPPRSLLAPPPPPPHLPPPPVPTPSEEEWYQVFPSQVHPATSLSGGGIWKTDRHGQWWPVYPDDPPDILEQCAVGMIWRCRRRQCIKLNPANPKWAVPKSHTAHLRQVTLTQGSSPRAPTPLPQRPRPPSARRPTLQEASRGHSALRFPAKKAAEQLLRPRRKSVTYFRL